eukprot:522791-Pleurochrysis_carterae.AAC.4
MNYASWKPGSALWSAKRTSDETAVVRGLQRWWMSSADTMSSKIWSSGQDRAEGKLHTLRGLLGWDGTGARRHGR